MCAQVQFWRAIHFGSEFSDRRAFFDVDDARRTLTGDREEFVGRNGSLRNPAALKRTRLSGKTGAGLDPCAAIQVGFELADGQEREIIFRLGVGHDAEDAGKLVQRFRGGVATAGLPLEAVRRRTGRMRWAPCRWKRRTRRWMCSPMAGCSIRPWPAAYGRAAAAQSGGAFGFRDQLQDMMALVYTGPRFAARASARVCQPPVPRG